MLYPGGRLVDAPLPAWTHRQLLLTRDGQDHQAPGACTVAVHPLLGPHVRLQEEPERHAWQAEVGTEALPWLGDHQIHNVAALPGAAYCEMALAAARATLGEASEVRDIRFEQMLLLDDETPVAAAASVHRPASSTSWWRPTRTGNATRRATAVLHAADDEQQPPAQDMAALLAAHPRRVDGTELRQWFDDAWCPVRPGLHRSGRRAHRRQADTVLAEVGLPSSIRSQQSAFRMHPALLDACFQSVAAHPAIQGARQRWPAVAVGCAPATRLRSYPQRPLLLYAGDHRRTGWGRGRPRCVGRARHSPADRAWAAMGTGVSESTDRDRVLGERLLTIEWQQRELPEVARADAGTWLLISTSRLPRSAGHQVDRCVEIPRRGMHHHVLAAACRPLGQRRTACGSSCVPADSPVWSSSPGHATATRMRSVAVRGASMCVIWCASPASCRKSRANRLGCMS